MSLYAPSIDTRIPLLVESLLRQNSALSQYFLHIGALDMNELLTEMPEPPFLAIVPEAWSDGRRVGGRLEGQFAVNIIAVLQPPIATDPDVTAPAPVTLAEGSSGPLNGIYRYGLCGFTRTGLSVLKTIVMGAGFVEPAVGEITVTAKRIMVTPPAVGSYEGFLLFRTEANRQRLLFHSILYDSLPFDDVKADSDLGPEEAPVRFGGRSLMAILKEALYLDETLKIAGSDTARAVTLISELPESIRADRNVRTMGIKSTYQVVFDRSDRLT